MSRLHPRTLLRIVGRQGVRSIASRPAPVEWVLDEAYSLPFLSRAHANEQPVPSSSKVTLDILGMDPHADRGPRQEPDQELNFADDADLLSSLFDGALLPPSAAYRALRQSPLFGTHLQSLLPRIGDVYSALRTDNEGDHNTLVADLLLRSPTPSALRSILLVEASHFPEHPVDALSKGLIVQAYRAIIPSLRRRALAPLSPTSLAVVARAVMAAGHAHLDVLDHVYYQLAHTASWTREDGWPALAILLHLSKHGRAEHALKLLDYPVSLGKLPAAMGRTSTSHSEPATLLAQSAVVRCALYWGLDLRAYSAVDDLVTTMSRTAVSGPALELVLTAARGASVRRRAPDVAWAGRTLLALAADEAFPPLPSIDWYYNTLSPTAALQFYTSLPENRAAPPSPRQILRMSLSRPEKPALRRLAGDLARAQHAAPAVPAMLKALAAARLLRPAENIYTAWSKENTLDGATTLVMVRALTRGARRAGHSALARKILCDYLTSPALDKESVALHAHALLGAPTEGEQGELKDIVTKLVMTRGVEAAQDQIDDLARSHPSLAHRLAQIASEHALAPPRQPVVLAASCAAGHWGALAAAGGAKDTGVQAGVVGSGPKVPLTPIEEGCITALKKARQGRMAVAVRKFTEACIEDARVRGLDFDEGQLERSGREELVGAGIGLTDAVIPPTAAALLRRCAALRRWEDGFAVLSAALRVTGEDGVVEAAGVFISAVAKAGDAQVLTKHLDQLRLLLERLEPASQVLLETMLENASRQLGVQVEEMLEEEA
ncbi:hypothetical protein CspeluHIS016_0300260 [Cutaneotrichosporon spelunceum]|uniref:Uncharacterized protein n=1 Tax=Cutaneotrichosporon spelunceum TaxID=1672016 RepID=A0AAD3TSL1_9TREE|nr:hypothetical protein CspeluHIS016_0300260 [Cutaneotrichosporon spelunceum]